MARMIPSHGPVKNNSKSAESSLYFALKNQLPDDFTVIHSLPWLSMATKEFTGKVSPTGETDFLILHPSLGILAIEVKGGMLRYEDGSFVFPNGIKVDPVQQVRKGVFALTHHLQNQGERIGIGYAVAFPESSMQGRVIPPALKDLSQEKPENICIDKPSLLHLNQRIHEIMCYWQRALWKPKAAQIQRIINILCPTEEYIPRWNERIEEDTQRWLLLTTEQNKILQQLQDKTRAVLTGRSGTGKTLLAMMRARQFAKFGKTVLFLVYNVPLAEFVREALKDVPSIKVNNFHQLCREAGQVLREYEAIPNDPRWYKEIAPQWLKQAVLQHKLSPFDTLVLDEAQILAEDWLKDLEHFFTGKPILACCDELQAFSFEHKTSAQQIADLLQATTPFVLTVNVRSPHPVFERLSHIQPTSYQQISLRPEEKDTLEELVSVDPLTELQQKIQQLHQEGISPQSILVIYLNKEPSFDPNIKRLIGRTISVHRCRGIEAPVVIVLVDREAKDIELACAYSRATSRCIVIYHQVAFVNDFLVDSKSVFLQHIRSDHASIDQWVKNIWPPTKRLELTTILGPGRELTWSHQWDGWVLHASEDDIADALWIGHLAFCSSYATYVITNQEHTVRSMKVYGPALSFKDDLPITSVRFMWCDRCRWWGRNQLQDDRSYICLDCQARHGQDFSPSNEDEERQHNAISVKPPLQDSLFLQLLKNWQELSSEQRAPFREDSLKIHRWDPPVRCLARLTIILAIAKSSVGDLLQTEELQLQSWESSPWLHTQIKQQDWNWHIASQLGVLQNTRPWIKKQEKGIHRIMPLEERRNE